jgi:hypothetical protein
MADCLMSFFIICAMQVFRLGVLSVDEKVAFFIDGSYYCLISDFYLFSKKFRESATGGN